MGVCECGWVYERENVLGRESARCVTKKEREREKEIEKEREKKLCISQNWNNFSFHVKTDKLSVHVMVDGRRDGPTVAISEEQVG